MLACGVTAATAPPVQDGDVALQPAGQGSLRWLGLAVYEARLWVAPGFRAARFAEHAFALELHYQRAFSAAVFVLNGRPRGEIADPRFAARFFGIWLAPATSEPALREALLADTAP